MLTCFDSEDKISGCLMVEEGTICAKQLYLSKMCLFCCPFNSHLKNLFEKAQYFFFLRGKS